MRSPEGEPSGKLPGPKSLISNRPSTRSRAFRREIGVGGPIREQYLVTPFDTEDESDLVTEVCWPVVRAVTPDRLRSGPGRP